MLKQIIILVLVSAPFIGFAQQEEGQFIHKHLVRADASIIAGVMLKDNINNVHVNGNLEYYLDTKISVRGDCNYMLGSNGLTIDSTGLKDNHSVMLGAVYHFPTTTHFDPYFILQPGFAYTSSYNAGYQSLSQDHAKTIYYKPVISPLATAGLGFNYYFQRFAHLFLETRYVYGQHLSDAPQPISLEEFRITFGLGFNLF
ncbi:MAG: hypothetical protein A3F72_00555 [Bacteroidetes bacterium RIFCSPLOWO2_12_FULL_35_15]|nr:MAG: hypothetical protein A3F72_00555 [Bacteroidetes bacterium RIFCSPLOWO2_12_FULL_35_15]